MLLITRIVLFFPFYVTIVHSFQSFFRYNHDDASLIVRNEKSQRVKTKFEDLAAYDFPQKLDHFNVLDQRTWNQRHWRITSHYELNGPVFLFLGGETVADPQVLTTSGWSNYAVSHKAIMFLLEHRFYGYSQPFENHNTSNLRYLSAEQAIADVAYFIEDMNRENHLPEGTKWIVLGCSYAGSLAAWVRMKYPHLVFAAYASSAPLLAKADFKEYYIAVEEALESYDEKCVVNIRKAGLLLSKMIKSRQGRKEIKDFFNLCDDLKKKNDIITFFGYLVDTLGMVVQYHNQLKTLNINSLCDMMAESTEDEISKVEQLAKVVKATSSLSVESECLSASYNKLIAFYQNVTNTLQFNRPWLYQTCTEYGYFGTQSRKSDLFGPHIPLQYFTKLCRDVFGSSFDSTLLLNEAVQHTNRVFGGLNINTTNILFVHGSVDPWRTLGATDFDVNKAHRVIYIQGASHCADLWQRFSDEEKQEVNHKITEAIDPWFQSEMNMNTVLEEQDRPDDYYMLMCSSNDEGKNCS